jgi:myo-inositol-1(or 4)-monophosphatase
VAAGRRSAYLTEGDVSDSVHFAAGIVLCRAAGCVVTDLRGGPVDSGDGLAVAADTGTHRALLDLL